MTSFKNPIWIVLLVATLVGSWLFASRPLQSQPSDVTVSVVQQETQIPVLLPSDALLNQGLADPLFPEIISINADGYYVAYGFVEGCADAGFCNHARVQGYRLGLTGGHFRPDTLDALIQERTDVLADAPHVSPDPIQTITLQDGTPATVLPWFSYLNPGNTEVIFERDGIRYIFSVEMAPNAEAIALTNSALSP